VKSTIERLRSEFLEMPGLTLGAAQIRRLCGLELGKCQRALDALVAEGFLRLHSDGRYARTTDGRLHRPRLPSADRKTGDGG
jgi:hypothetical protein